MVSALNFLVAGSRRSSEMLCLHLVLGDYPELTLSLFTVTYPKVFEVEMACVGSFVSLRYN